MARIVSTLYEAARNDGKAPQHRAMNYATTSVFRAITPFLTNKVFRDMFGGLNNVAVDSVSVKTAACQRTGAEYDVDISLYSFENVLRGLIVLSKTVDVSQTVPVTIGDLRVSTRRSS